MNDNSPKVGISSCLLGNKVRFDGGHKNNRYLSNTLVNYFDFVTMCPEAGAGMGIPREPIRLVQYGEDVRAIGVKDQSQDYTKPLENFGVQSSHTLERLSGFILKKDSPSCGMQRVKIYNGHYPDASPQRVGEGLFARFLKQHYPHLPVEEEGRMCDPVLRENFIERVYIYRRWQELEEKGIKPVDLIRFHSDHKYIIMAHDQYKAVLLGRLVAKAGREYFEEIKANYIDLLTEILKKRVSRGQHANVLFHLMGYLRPELDSADRNELSSTIEEYRNGYVPLIVPITLLKHHFRKYPHSYINRQHYLNPHPCKLMLRNSL